MATRTYTLTDKEQGTIRLALISYITHLKDIAAERGTTNGAIEDTKAVYRKIKD